MMVGLSMALVIVIVIAAFIWTYLRVGPFLSDFIPSGNPAAAVTTQLSASPTPTPNGTAPLSSLPLATPSTTRQSIATPAPTPVWTATHRIAPDRPNINFRTGPSTVSEIVESLPPGTPLQFLGDQQDTGGVTWMKFETKDGKIGWVRKIDIVAVATATP